MRPRVFAQKIEAGSWKSSGEVVLYKALEMHILTIGFHDGKPQRPPETGRTTIPSECNDLGRIFFPDVEKTGHNQRGVN